MKELKRLIAVVAVAVVAGFWGPVMMLAQTNSTTVPLTTILFNDCTTEEVFIQGELTFTTHETFDQSGGTHIDLHTLSKGQGFGLITGAKYNYSEEVQNLFQSPGPPETMTQQFVLNHVLVAAGPVPNLYLRVRVHMTFNASGMPTATVDDVQMDCH